MKVEDENRSVQNRSGSGIMTFKKWLYKLRILTLKPTPTHKTWHTLKAGFSCFQLFYLTNGCGRTENKVTWTQSSAVQKNKFLVTAWK